MNRAFKVFIRSLQRLSFAKLWLLIRITLPHPLFSLLSLYASFKTFSLARKYFPKTSSSNGVGNAFRHALWCCLILNYCSKISSPRKSLVWCKKITDLHETLFPNEPLETKMDLHNNQVGMDLFKRMLNDIHRQFFENSFFIDALFEKVKTAKLITSEDDPLGDDLVYLEE